MREKINKINSPPHFNRVVASDH